MTSMKGKCNQGTMASLSQGRLPVDLLGDGHFRGVVNTDLCGNVLPEHEQLVHGLLQENSLNIYTSCTISKDATPKKPSRAPTMLACELDITIYGPFHLLEEIGSWFEEYEVYLQDPLECRHDVRYCNPQRLSCEDYKSCPLVSTIVSQLSQLSVLENLPKQPDLLDVLSSQIQLEEAEQPVAIQTCLQRQDISYAFRYTLVNSAFPATKNRPSRLCFNGSRGGPLTTVDQICGKPWAQMNINSTYHLPLLFSDAYSL